MDGYWEMVIDILEMVRLYIAWKEPNINPKNIFSCDYSCQYSLRAARNAGLFLPAFLPALKVVIT